MGRWTVSVRAPTPTSPDPARRGQRAPAWSGLSTGSGADRHRLFVNSGGVIRGPGAAHPEAGEPAHPAGHARRPCRRRALARRACCQFPGAGRAATGRCEAYRDDVSAHELVDLPPRRRHAPGEAAERISVRRIAARERAAPPPTSWSPSRPSPSPARSGPGGGQAVEAHSPIAAVVGPQGDLVGADRVGRRAPPPRRASGRSRHGDHDLAGHRGGPDDGILTWRKSATMTSRPCRWWPAAWCGDGHRRSPARRSSGCCSRPE